MTVSIMQPYLFPYLGYFQLMESSDIFISHDDVQYIKGGWINRNRILMNESDYMFTFSMINDSSSKNINERFFTKRFPQQFGKLERTLQTSYANAPFFDETMELIVDIKEKMKSSDKESIAEKIHQSLVKLVAYLDIEVELQKSSEIKKNDELDGEDRVIELCKQVGADKYVNSPGGKHLYEQEKFIKNGMELFFLEPELTPYKQFDHDFVSGLSIIDVLMFNSKDMVKEYLTNYTLTKAEN